MRKSLLTMLSYIIGAAAMSAVTFNVTVPDDTKQCFIAGDFNGWDAGNAIELTSSGENTFTLTLDDVTVDAAQKGYKYLCGQDWLYVEKGADGEELDNRTVVNEMDEVLNWASMPNPSLTTAELTINGYKRTVKIYLPTNYENNTKSYPVVYYTGVQQRYHNAGDGYGDDFFNADSWNVPGFFDVLADEQQVILVQMHGFVAENIPYAYEDFAGSGVADKFIDDFVDTLIPYINANYRTATGAENTSIVGADLGGMLSVYAALRHPDVFGQCVSMSPMIWMNRDEIINYASTATEGSTQQRFYFSNGSKETDLVKDDVRALKAAIDERSNAKTRLLVYTNGIHDDLSWGKTFESIYPYLLKDEEDETNQEITLTATSHPSITTMATDLTTASYSIVSAIDSQNLTYNADAPFSYVEKYCKSGTDVAAQVSIARLGVDIKSKYYWNVSRSADGTGELLLSSNKNVGFKSSKTTESWHRVVVYEDESIENCAVNSEAFRLVTAAATITMSVVSDFKVTASATFSTDKTFTINYGSVNSGSDQGAITEILSVPNNCTAADITYDFLTNQVAISVTETGESEGGSDDDTATDISKTAYSIVSAVDSQDLVYDATSQFSYITNFISNNTEVAAQVVITEIPVDVKTIYYWNVSRSADGTGERLLSSNKDIGFSSKKSAVSWNRVAILEDESIVSVAASSAAFRLATSSESILMTSDSDYKVKASATFTGSDKSFTIHYGSVNSGSDMGAITSSYTVADNCTAADIVYDFFTNSATITETAWGETIEGVVIEQFTAVPSFVNAGTASKVTVKLADGADCDVALRMNHNYGEYSEQALTDEGNNTWSFTLSNTEEGIYHIALDLKRGETTLSDAETICIKVLNGENEDKIVTINAYEDVVWESTGRYKANFHTHTTQSFDANFRVDETVDLYHQADYKILALTDHDANPYPWEMFDLFNAEAESRNPWSLGMLAIPGNELSKDNRNSWSEEGGGEFNHHNDFFTGRKGQEFRTLQESYAYTEAIGGMQIINHPGQYWNLSTKYTAGAKNSPEWHANNFLTYNSLIGLEVYNQGNRRPNDRILWDQILDITMPERPVWGYSCDDTHNREQFFRNYEFMLMPELTVDALKDAMKAGSLYFSYEYTGSGEAKAPRIESIAVDNDTHTITIATDASDIYWISSTDISDASNPSTRKSTILGIGKTFDFTGFQGKYVRALIVNEFGETCTQPFGFTNSTDVEIENVETASVAISVYPNPTSDIVNVKSTDCISEITLYNSLGQRVRHLAADAETATIDVTGLAKGHYVIHVITATQIHSQTLIIK